MQNSRGAAAAEMVLMLPLLVILLFVTFEGGYFLWSEHKVVKGVRDGARYAGRLDFSNYTCSSSAADATATTNIKNLTRTGELSGGTAVVRGWQNAHITVSVSCVTGQGGLYDSVSGNAPRVTVSAAVPYPSSPLSDLVSVLGFDSGSINLRASAQSSVMGL
ncbi:pilus assembly protein TadE [Altererythrobacter soli]|uniref:Pilus assembly protein TadE n=1 Tax=Croceibacterium soli TaxID=1739690 RepID=A0A6I4USK5_9SPHN|nr:pilus assembly protein TadE [Croceibacterium soli]